MSLAGSTLKDVICGIFNLKRVSALGKNIFSIKKADIRLISILTPTTGEITMYNVNDAASIDESKVTAL